jgi:hypothetical protein
MADDASRLFSLSDAALLTHFNTTYPQSTSSQMHHLTPEMLSALISALFKKRQLPESLLKEPLLPPQLGPSGLPSVTTSTLIPSFPNAQTPFPSYKYLPTATAMDPLLPAVDLSGLAQWKMPCVRWARRSPAWGPQTLA